jgi:dihydrofolate reductase
VPPSGKDVGVAKLVFGMNQSLDGYVDHAAFAPNPTLFRHFIEEAQGQAGSVYGRHTYEVMRYWDDDQPAWDAEERAFAAAWRHQPKWVVSRSLTSVGPNARLVEGDLERAIRELRAERDGEITPSCLVAASHISPDLGRRFALWLTIALERA